ncbi:MAG: glycosyltransferase family 2 protein [Candidatus Helarchaeota archaeon]
MSCSIVIPCYNAEKYLEETIKSILNQTVTPDEIIIINDCSTDKSVEIAEKFKQVIIYHNEKNRGIGYTRQAGLENASSEYVGFLSADDVYHKKFIEKALTQCKKDKGIYTDYYRCDSQLRPYEIVRSQNYSVESVIDEALRKNMYINFSSIIFPKDINVKFVEELRHGEDLIFLLDTLIYSEYQTHFDWERINEPLLYYRMHRLQGTPSYLRNLREVRLLWRYLKDRLMKLGVDGDLIENSYQVYMKKALKSKFNLFFNKFSRFINRIIY